MYNKFIQSTHVAVIMPSLISTNLSIKYEDTCNVNQSLILAEFEPGKLYPPMTLMYAFSSNDTHISLRLLE